VLDLDELRADCGRCVALCCVAPAFLRSADFAIDKPAGVPCLHLADDHRCSIHDRLRPSGFPGCVAFDCFGAGQRLTQDTFSGSDWRGTPEVAAPMMAAFPVLRGLHELLWHLLSASRWEQAAALRPDLLEAAQRVEDVAQLPGEQLARVDVDALRAAAGPLLREASAVLRAGLDGPDLEGADLAGEALRDRDLSGASFRNALLVGADLRRADLSYADLLGADLRGADLRGAQLETALFVTRTQIGGARGDLGTTLPALIERPAHWS
jgi:uncharacterized protein YjbI with pentapeptide repeats